MPMRAVVFLAFWARKMRVGKKAIMRKTLELTDWFLVHDDHGHVEEIVEATEFKWYRSKTKGGEEEKV